MAASDLNSADILAAGGRLIGPASSDLYWNLQSLRRWRPARSLLRSGAAIKHDINILSDSYAQRKSRYTQDLATDLQKGLGDGGPGWIGFGYPPTGQSQVNGSVFFTRYPIAFTGTWTANYNGAVYSPDISAAVSSTNGSRIMVGFEAGMASIVLLYGSMADGTNVGTMRYSYDNGATWTPFSLTGNSAGSLNLTNVPTTAFTLTLEVVGTNTCRVAGVYGRKASSGVILNVTASSGARAEQFANFQNGVHRPQVALLNPKMFILSFGPNDQNPLDEPPEPSRARTKAQFKADNKTIINSCKMATQEPDIMLFAVLENNMGWAQKMSEYQDAYRELAVEFDTGFSNGQVAAGPNPAIYAFNGTRPLMNSDRLHIDEGVARPGGALWKDILYNALMFG